MTRHSLVDHIIAEHKRTGRKPSRIDLSPADVAELEADIGAATRARRLHE